MRPIIVTDAGFRAPWFAAVQQLGWHWLGRIRGRDLLRPAGQSQASWQSCRSLWPSATAVPADLGAYECVCSRPHVSHSDDATDDLGRVPLGFVPQPSLPSYALRSSRWV